MPIWHKEALSNRNDVYGIDKTNRKGWDRVVSLCTIPDYGHCISFIGSDMKRLPAMVRLFQKVLPWKCAKRKFGSATTACVKRDPLIKEFLITVVQWVLLANHGRTVFGMRSRPRDHRQRQWIYTYVRSGFRVILEKWSYLIILCVREYIIAMARSCYAWMSHVQSLSFDWDEFVRHTRIQTHVLRQWFMSVPAGHIHSTDRLDHLINNACCGACSHQIQTITLYFKRAFPKHTKPPKPLLTILSDHHVDGMSGMAQRINDMNAVFVGCIYSQSSDHVSYVKNHPAVSAVVGTLVRDLGRQRMLSVNALPMHHYLAQRRSRLVRLACDVFDVPTYVSHTHICITCMTHNRYVHVNHGESMKSALVNATVDLYSVHSRINSGHGKEKLRGKRRRKKRREITSAYGYTDDSALDPHTGRVVCRRHGHPLVAIPLCGTVMTLHNEQHIVCGSCGKIVIYDDSSCRHTSNGVICSTCNKRRLSDRFIEWSNLVYHKPIACRVCGKQMKRLSDITLLYGSIAICDGHLSQRLLQSIQGADITDGEELLTFIKQYRTSRTEERKMDKRARARLSVAVMRIKRMNKRSH